MSILETIHSPLDVKRLTVFEQETLCEELREQILYTVSRNGGHLSSNLGAVELTVALHACFEPPVDKLVFDVGHQCYAHKLLTGRKDRFHTLRQFGGLSGFPRPDGSVNTEAVPVRMRAIATPFTQATAAPRCRPVPALPPDCGWGISRATPSPWWATAP